MKMSHASHIVSSTAGSYYATSGYLSRVALPTYNVRWDAITTVAAPTSQIERHVIIKGFPGIDHQGAGLSREREQHTWNARAGAGSTVRC